MGTRDDKSDGLGELKTPIPAVYVVKPERSNKSLFIYVPLLLLSTLLIALFVSWSFGWFNFETHTPADLYPRLSDGRPEVRRMAAVEWAQMLTQADQSKNLNEKGSLEQLRPNADQSAHILAYLQNYSQAGQMYDARYLSALVVTLGFSQDVEFTRSSLLNFLKDLGQDSQAELQFYTLLALARLGLDESKTAQNLPVLERAQNADASIRKATAFTLGQGRANHEAQALSPEFRQALVKLLEDANPAVRWNAALSLARRNDKSGYSIIGKIIEDMQNLKSNSVSLDLLDLYIETLQVLFLVKEPLFRDTISEMAQAHPNLKIRQSAKTYRY